MVLVHWVWATMRRRRILEPRFDPLLASILRRQALDVGSFVVAIGIAPDHVHALVRLAPTSCVAELARRLKGASAHFANHSARPLLSRLRWQAGYWAESVAPCDLDALARYLGDQRLRHDDSHPLETWQMADTQQLEPAPGGL